jgi:hypothetical protein
MAVAQNESKMSEPKLGLKRLGLDNAIRLRWVLRDIQGKRLKWSPPAPHDLRTLIELGFVQVGRDEVPIVTGNGLVEMDLGD